MSAKSFVDILKEYEEEPVAKFNQNHGADGKFSSSNGGGAADVSAISTKYKEMKPVGSYENNPEYKALSQKAFESWNDSQKASEELKTMKEQLNQESTPKPKSEWTMEDEFNAILGEKPVTYTEKGKQLKADYEKKYEEKKQEDAEHQKAIEEMKPFKAAAHEQQAAEHDYKTPEKATRTEYDGFKTDETRTSYIDDSIKSGRAYIAEMSPKEYIERCAIEIFDGATIESTISGTSQKSIAEYTQMMKDGVKFDTPYLNFESGNQEGRHRALAAYNLGIDKIPVVIIGTPVRKSAGGTMETRTAKSFNEALEEVEKYNHNHGAGGKFTSGTGGGATMGGSAGGETVGTPEKVTFTANGKSMALENLSIESRFGAKEIKNVIADSPRNGNKIAENLNREEWISGSFKAIGAGDNPKGCTLSHTDVFGNKGTLNISYKDIEKSDNFTIYKADDDKRLVFGWASVAIRSDGEQIEDRQHDVVDPDELESAAYDYVLEFRDGGEEHNPALRKKAKLVESCVFTKEKQEAIGIPEGIIPEGWWIGFKVEDEDAWEKVKNGTYSMFSVEGKGVREEIKEEEGDEDGNET